MARERDDELIEEEGDVSLQKIKIEGDAVRNDFNRKRGYRRKGKFNFMGIYGDRGESISCGDL